VKQLLDFIERYRQVREEELDDIRENVQVAQFRKNTCLQKQGESADYAGFIIKGAVRSFYVDEKGEEHTVSFVFEHQPLFQLESFMYNMPAATSSVTLESTEVYYVSRSNFFRFLEKYPVYEKVLRDILSEYLLLEGKNSQLLRLSSARERYERFLSMYPEAVKRAPLKYIASYLGMAKESISRIRSGRQ